MANPDVKVNISDSKGEFTDTDFSLILIISGDGISEYKEYILDGGIENSHIEDDYDTSTDTYKKASTIAMQKPSPSKVAIIGCSTDTGQSLVDKLNKMLVEHDTFFRVITTVSESPEKLSIAKWAETNNKFAYLQYDNTNFTEDYSTVNSRLLFHKTANEHLDAAEVGYAATLVPGTFILKFRSYKGVAAENITEEEKIAIEAKNMGYYIKVSGIEMQRSSRSSSYSTVNPLYIDDLESRIYTKIMLQNKLLDMLVSNKKVGSDISGLQLIQATMNNVLEQNYTSGIIAPDAENKPNFNVDISSALFAKVNRGWSGIKFSYMYLHGTEEIEINGTVS